MVEFVHAYLVEEAQVNHEKLFFYSISISIIDIFSKQRILYAVAVLCWTCSGVQSNWADRTSGAAKFQQIVLSPPIAFHVQCVIELEC